VSIIVIEYRSAHGIAGNSGDQYTYSPRNLETFWLSASCTLGYKSHTAADVYSSWFYDTYIPTNIQ